MPTFDGQGSKSLHASAGTHVQRHQGKGSLQERLPSRHAMSKLAGGSPADRTMNQYAKATPNMQQTSQPSPGQMGPAAPFMNGVGNDNG